MPGPAQAAVAIVAFLFGAATGSFANVMVYRIPRRISIVSPRSSCLSCDSPIAWYDTIPLLSYLVLKGRCRNCGVRISVRCLVIESLMALAWAACGFRFGLSPELPAYLALFTFMIVFSAIDLEHRLLPNRLLASASILGGTLLVATSVLTEEWHRMATAAAGALLCATPYILLAFVRPQGIGGGDLKFSAYLGLHLGWLGLGHALMAILLGMLAGGVARGVAVRSRGKGEAPLGPALALGTAASVLVGRQVLTLWLG